MPDIHFPEASTIQGTIFSSGGPLSLEASDSTCSVFLQRPIEIFGSTETGGIGYRQQQKTDTPWQVFNQLCVQSEPQSQRMILKSPYLATSNWHQCDDKVSLINQDQFQLLGRIDRIVKLEEKRVSLDALETALKQSDWVKDAHVIILKRKRMQLAAVLSLTEKGENARACQSKFKFSQGLRQHLLNNFEAVTLPRRWRFIDELPMTTQGKRNTQALYGLFEHD